MNDRDEVLATAHSPLTPSAAPYPPVQRLNAVQAQFRASVLGKLRSGKYRLEEVRDCLCGSAQSTVVARHDRFGVPVGVRVCSNCGLARTSPRLAAENLAAFYEADYHGLHMGVPEPDPSTALFRVGQGHRIYEQVASELPTDRLRIAEIGCGTGQVLREFVAAAAADGRLTMAVGCEFASAYVRAGRRAGSDIRAGGPEALQPAGPFDLVIMSHVVEHFADVPADLASIARLVTPSGHLYAEVPGILMVHRKPEYDYEFLRYFTLAHMYHFSLETLVDALNRAGFELVRGDEEVRTIFRRAHEPAARDVARGSGRVLDYLAWLRSSRTVRARRLSLRIRRGAKTRIRSGTRSLLGDSAYRTVRGAVRQLRRMR